ncbi:MAG: HTH domain-containing protein, partial [Rhodobacteraceae bacterium]|nr:HTH domain-containing protein [Paracoccaceae bacterium]
MPGSWRKPAAIQLSAGNRGSHLMKPIRMLELIALFRARRRAMTAAEIAERLGASRRTIYRDIASLQAMG